MDVIRITLRSDLCAGNGESRGNAVDTDIVLTADGLPRIPARRLKGCLRAALIRDARRKIQSSAIPRAFCHSP